jgi:hypothetical protein
MGIKVIRDFQHGDHVVVRLEFAGPINLAGNTFNITLASNLNNTPEYDVTYVANTNGHADDNLVGGIINLVIDTANLTPNNYLYSITRTDPDDYQTTLARSGLHSVDMVESKKRL